MIEINVKHNFDRTIKLLNADLRKQVPFATAKTLNKMADYVKRATISEMKQKFDRPTPFTLNSLFIRYATKNKLSARVYVKDRELAKSKALSESIGHQFGGGPRIRKRLEFWFTQAGYITSSEYLVPASGAKLDAYGNMSRGQIAQVLSQLQAGSDATSFRTGSARSKAKRAASGYFWSRGGQLKRGVWQRFGFAAGGAVKPILIVSKAPIYKQRIDIDKLANQIISRDFDAEFKKQFNEAVRTAR